MNPYTATQFAGWQLFVNEPFNNTIAVINLVVFGTAPDQVFGLRPPMSSSVSRITSPSLKLPVDLAPVKRDADSVTWASNTTLDEDSDFFVANRGDNTIVRMRQDGTVVAVRPTGRTRRGRREVDLTLDVYLGRSRTFRVAIRPWVLDAEFARMQPGQAIPVAADHAEPGHVVLAFDMDEVRSIAGLGPFAGGPGGPIVRPEARDEREADR